jgi:hypothetical protein
MSAYLQDDDSEYKKFKKKIDASNDLEVAVGIHEDAGVNENGDDILTYAIWNHFGTATIPKRPFVDLAADRNQNWQRYVDEALGNLTDKDTSLKAEAGKVGDIAVKDMKAIIKNHEVPPPNGVRTVIRKGFNHPLVETGALLESIDYKIDE